MPVTDGAGEPYFIASVLVLYTSPVKLVPASICTSPLNPPADLIENSLRTYARAPVDRVIFVSVCVPAVPVLTISYVHGSDCCVTVTLTVPVTEEPIEMSPPVPAQ